MYMNLFLLKHFIDIDIFTETLFETLEIINQERKKCTLLGDFNLDLLKYNLHDKTNAFIENIFSLGYIPQITKPTRITTSSATLIDHIYTNNILSRPINGIVINDVADHFGIFHIEQHKNKNTHAKQIHKRFFSDINMMKFQELLQEIDFSTIEERECPNQAYDIFIDKYKTAFEAAFPLRLIGLNKKYIKREPWVTPGLLTSLRHKAKLLAMKLKNPTERSIQKYKMYRNQYNKIKRQMKRHFFQSKLDINKRSIKNTWQILRQAINKQNDKSKLPSTFSIDGRNITNQFQIAEAFNTFYSNIGKSTSQNVPKSNKHFTDYLQQPQINSMFLETVNESQILEIVHKLKPKMSSGHDGIPTKIVKHTILNIIKPLTYIINKSFITEIVPKN